MNRETVMESFFIEENTEKKTVMRFVAAVLRNLAIPKCTHIKNIENGHINCHTGTYETMTGVEINENNSDRESLDVCQANVG